VISGLEREGLGVAGEALLRRHLAPLRVLEAVALIAHAHRGHDRLVGYMRERVMACIALVIALEMRLMGEDDAPVLGSIDRGMTEHALAHGGRRACVDQDRGPIRLLGNVAKIDSGHRADVHLLLNMAGVAVGRRLVAHHAAVHACLGGEIRMGLSRPVLDVTIGAQHVRWGVAVAALSGRHDALRAVVQAVAEKARVHDRTIGGARLVRCTKMARCALHEQMVSVAEDQT